MADYEKLTKTEKEIVDDLNSEFELLVSQREHAFGEEKGFYDRAIDSFLKKVETKSLGGVLKEELLKKLDLIRNPKQILIKKQPSLPTIKLGKEGRIVTVKGMLKVDKKQKKGLMEDLQIAESNLKRLKIMIDEKNKAKKKKPGETEFRKPDAFVKISSKIFSPLSFYLSKTGFKELHSNLRKAAMPFLLPSYISLMLFSTTIAFIAGIIGSIIITFITSPDLSAVIFTRNLVVSFILPFLIFVLFYIYPSSQISSYKIKIENELPFAIMHMATIAGSGVEPTRVFRIIALSEDYPGIGKEARKIMNQINFYGYDFVSALRETAKTTSSDKFAELLNGMATITSTGGNLQSYLDQSSKNALVDYRLKRKKYTEASGTYADVYTGLLITAPLLFMLLLALVKPLGMEKTMDTTTLGIAGIGAIIVLNIGFIAFLSMSQPEG